MSEEELWEDIPGYEGYQAHPSGEIRSKKYKRLLKGESPKHKYRFLTISGGRLIAAHRLVALAFCPNPNNLPQVNHKDRNTRNNKSENLEWVSASENVSHAIATRERKKKKKILTPVRITKRDGTVIDFPSTEAATEYLGTKKKVVSVRLYGDGYYYGESNGPKNKKDWLWKVERIEPKEEEKDYEEKTVTIEGYTHLIARSNGEIINKRTRKTVGCADGRYVRITSLKIDGKRLSKSAHQIIAKTFIPNPEDKPNVNHIDGNTFNNAVSNLEWCTQKENVAHARRTGLISKDTQKIITEKLGVPVYQLELDGTVIKKFNSAADADREMGTPVTAVCICYRNNTSSTSNVGGYGWCHVENFSEPRVNRSFSKLFPELVGRKDINFDLIRPYVVRTSRPIWQIDLDGIRIRKWNSMSHSKLVANICTISQSVRSGGDKMGVGYFWKHVTYEELLNPKEEYTPIIPKLVRNSLKIPEDTHLWIRPSIVKLVRENVVDGYLRIKVRPILQMNLDGSEVRRWSGPTKAAKELGYGRNQIESALHGYSETSNGYKWRWLTLKEICYDPWEEEL